MSIQWYPGHMTKARRAIAETMPSQDVVIEVLDARMPLASSNPLVSELRRHKPCIKILNKRDLADPAITTEWVRYFEAEPPVKNSGRVRAVALSADKPSEVKSRIPELCKALVPHKGGLGKPVRAMIVGIPNVGKSTLINTLMDRKVAKVSDRPAVTKSEQKVILSSGMILSDNPGILWPKIEDEAASYRLAIGGAIPETALDYETIGLVAAEYLLRRYPALLLARYKLTELPESPTALILAVGRRRGCLRSEGVVDRHKASDILIHDFRGGLLGRVSLEEPPDHRAPSVAQPARGLDDGDDFADML